MQKAVAILGAVLASLFINVAVTADTVPTIDQVYQAAKSGHLNDAQKMMDKVLAAHPTSAKAHYVEAELLLKANQMTRAREELASAEQLQPGLPFANPVAVAKLKTALGLSSGQNSGATAQSPGNSFPWGAVLLIGGIIMAIVLIIKALIGRSKSVATVAPAVGQVGSMPMGTGYTAGGGIGSGLASGLATGVGVGAGIVAGEMLADRLLGGHTGSTGAIHTTSSDPLSANADMGGNDFGIADNSGWDSGDSGGFSDGGGSDSGGGW